MVSLISFILCPWKDMIALVERPMSWLLAITKSEQDDAPVQRLAVLVQIVVGDFSSLQKKGSARRQASGAGSDDSP